MPRDIFCLVAMRKHLSFCLVIAFSILALVVSAILFIDYVKPQAVFCDEQGGCGAMKHTSIAYPFRVPAPVFGISGFLAIALTQLAAGRRARIAQAVLAVTGALVALYFLYVQATMKTVCPYCAVVDVSALVIAGLSIARLVRGTDPPAGKMIPGGTAIALAASIAIPIGIGVTKRPLQGNVPDVIMQEIREAPRGKLTVIDFADFECPHCRNVHRELAALLEEHKDKIYLVRKHVPLSMHPHAINAARAAVCGELMGKRDEMADALFVAGDLSPAGCEAIAKDLHLDIEKFRACVESPATRARIEADRATFQAAHGRGLPTLWFGTTQLVGAHDRDTLRKALESSLKELEEPKR
ncbi:MAG: thioredoxin domain-containing protein [Polyangiaceae bacterium]|nr:thioredoxin domain-containing protein [Polyangiaceae bacterium]